MEEIPEMRLCDSYLLGFATLKKIKEGLSMCPVKKSEVGIKTIQKSTHSTCSV